MRVTYKQCDCCGKVIDLSGSYESTELRMKFGRSGGGHIVDFCKSCWDRIVREAKLEREMTEGGSHSETTNN